jgi:hypothetical protein
MLWSPFLYDRIILKVFLSIVLLLLLGRGVGRLGLLGLIVMGAILLRNGLVISHIRWHLQE